MRAAGLGCAVVAALLLIGGAAGLALDDPRPLMRSRAALGGEGLTPILGLFAAWLDAVTTAESPLDLVVPEAVEARMQPRLRDEEARRQARHEAWLAAFFASPAVTPEAAAMARGACGDRRASDPIGCHRAAAQALDAAIARVLERREGWKATLVAGGIAACAAAILGLVARGRRRRQGQARMASNGTGPASGPAADG